MEENNSEIIEEIIQREIADYIKNNRDKNGKEIYQEVSKLLDKKEKLYNIKKEDIKEFLNRGKENV